MTRLKAAFEKRERQMKDLTPILYAMILLGSLASLAIISLVVTLTIAILKHVGLL